MTFRAKLTLWVTGILAGVMIALFLVVTTTLDKSYDTAVEGIRTRSLANAEILQLEVGYDVATDSRPEIEKSVDKFKGNRPQSEVIIILDKEQTPLASTGEPKLAKSLLSNIELSDKAKATIDYNRALVVATTPVVTEMDTQGYAIYVESFKDLKKQRAEEFFGIIIAFLLGLLGAATAAFAMGTRSAGPIGQLVLASAQIADGDLATQKIEAEEDKSDKGFIKSISGKLFRFGEIRTLASSFRAMAAALRRIVSKLTSASHSISTAVRNINANSKELARGVELQSQSASNVFKSIEKVNASFVDIDANLGQLNMSADRGARATTDLRDGLKQLSGKVQDFSEFVTLTNNAVKQMATTTASIEKSIVTMAASTDNTAASVTEFDRSTQLIESSAAEATSFSEEVSTKARTGQDDVDSTISGMGDIVQSFDSLQNAFSALSERIDVISDRIQVIDDVSERTKLLSVNTNILASQAGEHGRAFAVIAGEIKALSERTNLSTREITEVILDLNRERTETIKAMELGIKSVRMGQNLAERAGESIKAILSLSEKSHNQIMQIATAAREQVQGSRAIAKATNNIATMGHDMQDSIEEQRQGAESVYQLVGQMVSTISGVRKTIESEAVASSEVAELIGTIYSMAESIQNASATFRKTSENIVSEIGTIRDVAGESFNRAQSVSDSIAELEERVASLNQDVDQFKVS